MTAILIASDLNSLRITIFHSHGTLPFLYRLVSQKGVQDHTRHRSIINAMTHLVAALAAYSIDPMRAEAVKLIASQKNWAERTPN